MRTFGNYQFEHVGIIEPAVDGAGIIMEYAYELPPDVRPNRYAQGPFCRFELLPASPHAGVYAITVAGELKYIGECKNLAGRFGPDGYGSISARNCHSDGQSTNCKVNALVLASAKSRQRIDVWFHQTARRKVVEAELVRLLAPPWNGSQAGSASRSPNNREAHTSVPTAEAFARALQAEFAHASARGQPSIRMHAGELHRTVGGYPGCSHRMPMCCQVMRSAMRQGDSIVASPPSGAGASLTIEYRLPRPA